MYRGAFASFIVFCLFGSIIAVLWYGVILVSNGDFDEGKLFSFVIYSAFIGVSFGGVADMYAKIQKAVGAVERLFELLDEEPEDIDIKNNNTHLSRFEGNVVFDKVDFTYPSRETMQILKSVSFTAKKGETVAFVGSSGSGKSTIVSLLLRFYEPNNGAVTIDGKNATSCNLSDLRNNMAIVPQEVLLFGGTIKENIAYGKPGASVSEIEEAAKKANAFDFIEGFPEKFETVVGDRGIKLSGGQRQRVAIARAVLKDPSILILDEATSALDSKSEQVVQEALDKLMENRTSFVIAHRLSTIRSADKIVVIEAGEVKEVGSHSELMAIDNGVYKSLSALQSDVIQ
jgi:ABC-type multidrug transport system fused ATPase/permease subunit